MIIVSLTTIPPRFNYLHITIDSILSQTILPDKIIINIPNFFLGVIQIMHYILKQKIKKYIMKYIVK